MAYQYSNPKNDNLNFDSLFRANVKWPPADPIPKVVHFLHTRVSELTWLQWAAVRGAVINLGVDEVRIWVPEKEELKGRIWNRVVEMPEVKLKRIVMPKTVFGASIGNSEQQADILRLKILYEEGGIFLDNDLVALKSSDDIIYNNSTRSTVMALQPRGNGIPNGFIMSKPRSPFIKRWIQQYRKVKEKNIWNELSASRPHDMYTDMDPDLTVLGGQSWFYPLSSQKDRGTGLKSLWFGKSWHDIEKSYGTHFWHQTIEFAKAITPKTIQTIDTPLFCQIRKLFDNLDGDGYFSVPAEKNANCSITWTSDLRQKNHRMFSDYRMATDDIDIKWVDSSGFNNHGWAPTGTLLQQNNKSGPAIRNITPKSYAVLPVPADWDARVWSIRTTFHADTKNIAEGDGVGIYKIRMEDGGEILVRVRNDNPFPGITVKLEWVGNKLAGKELQKLDDLIWVSEAGLPRLKTGPHEMAISFDSRDRGAVNLYLDGIRIANRSIPLIASPKIGQEIWFNAEDWTKLDSGFRGTLNRFTAYADAISPEDMALPISTSSYTISQISNIKHINIYRAAASPWALFFPAVMLVMLLFLGRRKKAWLITLLDFLMTQLPAFIKIVPSLITQLASRTPFLRRESHDDKD